MCKGKIILIDLFTNDGNFILYPYKNLTLANVSYIYVAATVKHMVLFRDSRLKNRFYVQEKIYFEGKKKKKKISLFTLKGRKNQS